MELFCVPDWNKNSLSEKMWKETVNLGKSSKISSCGNVRKYKSVKPESKKPKNRVQIFKEMKSEDTFKNKNVDQNKLVQKFQNKKKDKGFTKNSITKQNLQYKRKEIEFDKTCKEVKDQKFKVNGKFKQKPKQVMSIKLPTPKEKLKGISLREKMVAKLKAAKFRYLNEQMYNTEGKESLKYFETDSDSYKTYHEGYRQQVAKWPLNPLDVIIRNIKKMPQNTIVADFGCGEAKLAKSVPQLVHSFDLISLNECVQVCDMAHVPLEANTIDVVVFCLSLMGTNLKDYLLEANRVLRTGGIMKIAEIESRFDSVDGFIKNVKLFGFNLSRKDLSNNLFYFMDFKKEENVSIKKKLPIIKLKPCVYKKR